MAKKNSSSLSSLLSNPKNILVIILLVAVGAFYVGSNKEKLNVYNNNESSVVADETANWKTYTNTKYNYLIKFPQEYTAENFDAVGKGFQDAKADEKRFVGIYLNRNAPHYGGLIEVQTVFKNKSLKEYADENFQENTTHHLTQDFSPLKTGQLDDNSTYEYSYISSALHTLYWSALTTPTEEVLKTKEYKVIYAEKNNIIYAIYLMNTSLFNQILSTFKFTN